MHPSQSNQPMDSQFALLKQRRFAPFFWTQFCGAANDNLLKIALTIMLTYQFEVSWLAPNIAGLVIGAVFIAPFLIFSATSGQIADRFEKHTLMVWVKRIEIFIMLLATVGLISTQFPLLLGCIFFMGLHSTVFGPVKYAYLPQTLNERELTGGNGLVEMGTFVAILLGNILGSLLIAQPTYGAQLVSVACLVLAIIGWRCASRIPQTAASTPSLKMNLNPWSETYHTLRLARANIVVFRSLLGISWLWFFGALFLSQFPSLAKDVLHADAQVATVLLVVFSIGIGVGSMLCETLSRRHVELGLVPIGAIGMSIFSIDAGWATTQFHFASDTPMLGLAQVGMYWRVLMDLGLMSFCAGLFSVPMYALIQLRSPQTHRARIIAANNILNALFMIASAVIAGVLLKLNVSIGALFILTGIANFAVAAYIVLLTPEYLLRLIAWFTSHLMYRFQVQGEAHLPTKGAALLICNHVSYVDALLIMAASPRPIIFLMDHNIFQLPVLGWIFRLAKAIPVAPRAQDESVYRAAIDTAVNTLAAGEMVCIFPEGSITRDGTLQPMKPGVIKILDQASAAGHQVPVIPMGLSQLWGSFFSRIENGTAMRRPFRRGMYNKVTLRVGPPHTEPAPQLTWMETQIRQLMVDASAVATRS